MKLRLVESSDAAPEARSHAGQALGADFILTGQMHMTGARTTGHAAQTSSSTIELTGETVLHTSASTRHTTPGSASALFQVIEVSTRRIVLADRANLTGGTVEALAQHITDELIGTVYPPRLISTDDPTALVVSQGGNGMHPGQQFRLMSQGAEMFDPYTHESLGRIERTTGRVEITDVGPRISYAKLVDGALPPDGNAVLRPVPTPSTTVAVSPRRRRMSIVAAPVDDGAQTGVRLPGDH